MSLPPEKTLDWEELLLFIEERKVIPIVGKELLSVQDGERTVPLDRYLAGRLATALGLPREDLPADPDLNAVSCRYISRGGNRRKIYSAIRALFGERPIPLPRPLLKLAEITDFKLFVSTTFDSLLVEALDAVRFRGEARTRWAAFSPHSQPGDLPGEVRSLPAPMVYQLFGPLAASMDYAVTEEDVLEFLHLLQAPSRRPPILFDELQSHHLLLIGCGFPDWLARFFLRTVANQRLIVPHERSRIVVDSQASPESALAVFLRLYDTEVSFPGTAADFVDQLCGRWQSRRTAVSASPPAAVRGDRMPENAVFVSYAREDREHAEEIKRAFEEEGLEVWLDRDRLESGEDWSLEIQSNIRKCSLFLPLLSRNAQRRVEGFFRKEWRWAIERAQGMDDRFPFIQPLLVDDTLAGSAGFPEYFWTRQVERLPAGRPTPDLIRRARDVVREVRLREAGLG